jgi:hypothetical protein
MNLAALSLSLPLAALGLAALAGCNHSMSENHETTPERTGDASLTIMTFNVENLFDNVDDPGKEDRTYLALADKQSAEHKAACSEIQVDRWTEACRRRGRHPAGRWRPRPGYRRAAGGRKHRHPRAAAH